MTDDEHHRASKPKSSLVEAAETWLGEEVVMAKVVAEWLRAGFRRPDWPATEPITVPLVAAFPTGGERSSALLTDLELTL